MKFLLIPLFVLMPGTVSTQTLPWSKTECKHIIHDINFSVTFDKSELHRGYINHYTNLGSISVKTNDLFWNCHIS